MREPEKLIFTLFYIIIFVSAVFMFFTFLNNTEKKERIVARDTLSKASVEEHVGADKETTGLNAVKDVSGNVAYVPVKGSDVIFDLLNIIDAVNDKDIEAGKIKVTVKIRGGEIVPSNADLLKIKNRKTNVLDNLSSEIDKDAQYRRVYYYNDELSINELKYDL